MKQTLVIAIFLSLLSCSSGEKKNLHSGLNMTDSVDTQPVTIENGELERYIKSLDQISLPLKHSSTGDFSELSNNYDKQGFEKFKHVWTSKPLGLLFQTDKSVVTVDLSIGDISLIPFILTYDLKGNKIDSLGPYKKSGFDMGYAAVEYLTIKQDRTIMVTDSVKVWELNEDETDVIEGSMTVTVDTTIYRITDTGKIVKE
jgi:hypothetical protein